MTTRRVLRYSAAAMVLLAIGVFLSGRMHYVDNKPAIAAADNYFDALKLAQVDSAYSHYSDDFREQSKTVWRDLLFGLQQRYGPVTFFQVVGSKIVPVSGKGCTLLRYQVKRGGLVTDEKMLLCPDGSSKTIIIGHAMTRTDTGQMTYAGLVPREVEVHVP